MIIIWIYAVSFFKKIIWLGFYNGTAGDFIVFIVMASNAHVIEKAELTIILWTYLNLWMQPYAIHITEINKDAVWFRIFSHFLKNKIVDLLEPKFR